MPPPPPSGSQGFSEEDRAYAGSTFREVRAAVFANPYYRVWGADGEPPLPRYRVTFGSVLLGLLKAAKRTVDSGADLRWGPDGRGTRRLLHPNGVCLTGDWEVTAPTPYTGYFAPGRAGLVIARYSTCCTDTRRGRRRSLSLVGKLYPTTDPTSPVPVRPAAFITQQDIGGDRTDYINDAELRNAPDTTAWRRGLLGLPVIAVTGVAFRIADTHPSIRQLYEIAELDEPAAGPTRAPQFLRFRVDEAQPRIAGAGLDFRDEVLAQIYDRGAPEPRRALVFHIEVSDDGVTRGPPFYERRTITNWRRIGRLVFREAVASYNGDRVVHFHHPGWRRDANDPATAVRRGGRRAR